ncbi:hypothetical protein GCM10022267_11530 [Lentzea roselyniae]|uniref:Uncharacterized protein n=1 Tax=Lentzea roselyniae TaxID=531940 RepID=A0ABP7A8M4_9PSEU
MHLDLRVEVHVSTDDAGAGTGDIRRIGIKTTLTCPDCAGSLVELPVGGGVYRCLAGGAGGAGVLRKYLPHGGLRQETGR